MLHEFVVCRVYVEQSFSFGSNNCQSWWIKESRCSSGGLIFFFLSISSSLEIEIFSRSAEVAGMNRADGHGVLTLVDLGFTEIRIAGVLLVTHP